ncbi:DnaT-like ssDNA-binding domain-containing protein [Reinekea marinisedimentorum]|uniref:DnaT DNA-binding domain-containing protein n=1 Tax=Reinekea marinisedimentorum TaxID=230495 RepID=A0A4V2UK78_9GAMM|nr:DnaT-like ssDNA-binding domain-containing protein [Reinekea marinisedimentorum]TCS43192.1 hypothetical protein BCF53_102218 [Reinekea marinisedimentorum]
MLQISPTLAQTIGLEEALLLQLLQDAQAFQGGDRVVFSNDQREAFLPFWSLKQFTLVLKRLDSLGLVKVRGNGPWHIQLESITGSEPAPEHEPEPAAAPQAKPQAKPAPVVHQPVPVYNMNETARMNEARRRNQYEDDLSYLKPYERKSNAVAARKTRMHNEWEPSSDFPQMISFHSIPLQFALSELAKFRQYYGATDRAEFSWDVKFLNWVQRSWHDSLNTKGRNDRQKATAGKPADPAREQRNQVRDALRNIRDTDW